MLEADRYLFARLLVVAQTREMDLTEVFKYFLWLAKCCILYAQQNIFLFNSLQLYSTFYIYVQRCAFSFHIQLNYFHSTTIFIQLQ